MNVNGTALPAERPAEEELTEEERYNEVYYEEPAVYYQKERTSFGGRTADSLTLEEYIVSKLEDMETYISIRDYAVEFTMGEFKTFYW